MITPNALNLILNESQKLENFVIQVREIKRMQGDTILLIVSDGERYMEALLNSCYLGLIEKGVIVENQLILVDDYTVVIGDMPTVNIISMQPKQICQKIGTPTPLKFIPPNSSESYTPISALSSFLPDWTVRGKIIKKSEVSEYISKKTGRNEKLLSITLIDSENTQISACFFADAVDVFQKQIEEGKIYLFSSGTVSLNEQKFRTINNYKLLFNSKSVITLDQNQSWSFVNPEKNLVKIEDIPKKRENSSVDIMGIVLEVGLPVDRVSKKGANLVQRMLKVIDKSNTSIELCLWNELATDVRISNITPSSTVIQATGVIVTNFNGGLTLSTARNLTEITYDPDSEMAREFKAWFSKLQPGEMKILELSEKKEGNRSELPLKNIAEIKSMQPSTTDRYELIAYFRFIKLEDNNSLTYSACISCKKKITSDSTEYFNCNSCQKSNKTCMYRYLLRSMQIADFTGMFYTTAFNEVGEFLFQMKAQEFFHKTLEEKKEIIGKVQNHSYCFTVKALSGNSLDGTQRIEYTINSAYHVNHAEITKKTLGLLSNSIH